VRQNPQSGKLGPAELSTAKYTIHEGTVYKRAFLPESFYPTSCSLSYTLAQKPHFSTLAMFLKAALVAAALAAPALAYEPVTCQKNATQNIITSINPATKSFCTMLTGYGVYPVAPNEGCASVYCYGDKSNLGPEMPKGYILSTNFVVNTTYTQVTGCIDSSLWGQNPIDEGGQMDSHGWPYSCQGFKKFVSLIEPATNTYCLRCCNADNNVDCNTSKFIFMSITT